MGLITKEVITRWNPFTKKWYESKGYIFTKWKEEFEVKVEDLQDNSHILVDVECDGCKDILKDVIWESYKKHIQNEEKYYCKKCANNGYKKYITFYEWCSRNLSIELMTKIISSWDYELNKCSPKDVSFNSVGFNKKGYWFKCLDHPEHKSEQKNITSFSHKGRRNINCDQCNSIAMTHPNLVKLLVNKEDSSKSFGSNEKIPMICPDCGYEKNISLSTLTKQGFGCQKCSDGLPYPEKFMFNVLEQLNIEFKRQLSKTTFDWCDKYKYDNYIKNKNYIIETHGIQHYEETQGHWYNINKTQENDKQKEKLAKENGIDKYIIIDCRKSKLEWIKNSIMNSELPTLLNFTEGDIDWLKCHEYACNSLVKVFCDLWNEHTYNILKIAEQLKIGSQTIRKYLKQGAELGWCDYNPKKRKSKN